MSNDLKPYENVSRVFWIKIELRDKSLNGRQDFGEIKDVISGEKKTITDLLDIPKFIIPCMRHMGIKVNWLWEFIIWLNRITSRIDTHGITLDK
jgi:hypothetical protein